MPQASLPSPRTWSANDLVTVPRLRADAADAIAFLLQRPAFAGQNTTGASWASGADNTMGVDSELFDTWAGHVPVSGGGALTSQYWAPVPGWYLCRCAPAFSYTSATQAMFAGGLQGITGGVAFGPARGPLVCDGSTNPPVPQCIDLIKLVNTGPPGGSGDYVQFTAIQTSGSSVNLVSASTQLPTASARWVCATSGTAPLPVPPLTATPSPITSAWLNADVRDTIRYLIYPPICKAFYASNSTSLASSTFPAGSAAPLNSVTVDNYSGFNTTTFTYTAPLAGRYLVAGQFNLQSVAAGGAYACGIAVNAGTTMWGDRTGKQSDTTGCGAGVVKRIRLNASDTVQLIASQSTGSSVTYNASGTNPTRMIVIWEGT